LLSLVGWVCSEARFKIGPLILLVGSVQMAKFRIAPLIPLVGSVPMARFRIDPLTQLGGRFIR